MPSPRALAEAPHTAVLDDAHLGDISGAFGRLSVRETRPRRSGRSRAAALAVISGPGLLALVADNDAGGIATYAQAGQNHGTRLLWVLVLLFPVLFVNQEMAARLGAVSGVGHARLIFARFGRFWGSFALGDLLVLNALTLLTEMIGVRLAADIVGVPPGLAVACASAALLLGLATGSFRAWERGMYLLIAIDVAIVPLAMITGGHVDAHDALVPGLSSGGASTTVLLVIALAGTTIAPWQLFFQQATVVDKRITPRWLVYERCETAVGAVLMVAGAAAVLVAVAAAAGGTGAAGHFTDAGGVAQLLGERFGAAARTLFAIVLLDGSLLGAAAVTLATAYAGSEVRGAPHSLHRQLQGAPFFYGVVAALMAGSAVVAMAPGVPLGLLTLAVQVLAGVLLPSATVFLLLLANDTQVLGPWVNGPWLNRLASVVIVGLLLLSTLLVVTALFPTAPLGPVALGLAAMAGAGLVAAGLVTSWGAQAWRRADVATDAGVDIDRRTLRLVRRGEVVVLPRSGDRVDPRMLRRRSWRMPPLEELKRPVMSRARTLAMLALRGYLIIAAGVLAARGLLALAGR